MTQKLMDFTLKPKNPDLMSDITMDQIHGWMQSHGEDWVDYHESAIPAEPFYEYIVSKRPVIKDHLDKVLDETKRIYKGRYGYSVQDIQNFYEEFYDDADSHKREEHHQAWHIFYTDYIEFVNTDNKYKAIINQELIEEAD